MKKTDIRNIALLAPVLYLYLNIFLWSKNVSMFSVTELICSLGAIFVLSALCYFIFYYLFSFFSATVQNVKRLKLGMGVFVGVFTGIICNFFFLRTLFYPHHHIAMYVLMVCIALIVYFNLAAYFVKFSYVLLLIASCGFVYNSYKNFSSVIEDTDKYLVEFKDKPNIYMIWLESFQGARTLKDVYDVDVSPLTKFLEENKFTVCENMYSGAFSTLKSMVDVFSLGAIIPDKYSIGNLDAYTSVRQLIGGGNGNNLLKVLKYNNYTTMSLLSTYFFSNKEKYLDFAPFVDENDFHNGRIKIFPCYAFSRKANDVWFTELSFLYDKKYELPTFEEQNSLMKNIELVIDKILCKKQPYFLSVRYDGTNHTPSDGTYKDTDRTEWIKSEVYKRAVEKSFSELQEMLSLIIKKDPDALIVMLGDHGAWSYRELQLNELPTTSIALDEYLDDKYNVYGAVHLPEKYAKFSFEDKGVYINNQNVFIQIFSLLAQDPEYLKLQKIPVSRYEVLDVIVNGIINEDVINKIWKK